MVNFLIKTFIKNSENTENPKIRQKYGTLSSIVGIICNVLLFLIKYAMGTLSHSISIVSDAFNNLSDCAGCLVTLLGYKMASKPADKNHPFGHGRMEYLTSLIIAALIIFVGIELLKNSVEKIINPVEIRFSFAVLISLVFSIAVKLWMAVFNAELGKKINSSVLTATAKDSKSDVIATSATLIALICSLFTALPVDGVMGLLVSVFILKSGYDIVKDTVDELLGKPADPEIINHIKEYVLKNDKIIGIHDLIIHSYGPGNMIGSCHVEVKSNESFTEVHDIVDSIEREIHNNLNILMTIHMDPIEVNDMLTNKCKKLVNNIIHSIDSSLDLHDFRIVSGESHTNLIFDLVVPFECKYSNEELKQKIDMQLSKENINYYTVIVFDKP
ncbi:cation diffusion facilitator family transporter [Porcipelethomonas ammoniilytica]|jgi:cation diffusion facilitator family transporter|uniref:cation diffusion facilitator family transporter n=1 Tax=Porcipelethomonas ammoniilytica TaxID=2981722 RepID=UPI0008232ACD|nr:cation diffusion facilitator family transporter [Porcipelethomonas ammoniilytica]MCU6718471.1 cation diffusion facilitator family transporter [Porcipelethomonas ammoniilytica]SCI51710.1 Ferrous-iron efflux pump FieF [uncultured Ruminococcus sp.]